MTYKTTEEIAKVMRDSLTTSNGGFVLPNQLIGPTSGPGQYPSVAATKATNSSIGIVLEDVENGKLITIAGRKWLVPEGSDIGEAIKAALAKLNLER